MANWSRMSYSRLVSAAHTLYTNARANPDIVAEMTEFGYTAPDDYDAGLALLADAHAATGTLAAEQADALAATWNAPSTARRASSASRRASSTSWCACTWHWWWIIKAYPTAHDLIVI